MTDLDQTEQSPLAPRTHDVVIVGGGPTGMMLAAELRIADVDVAIVERREDQEVEGSRAGGLHSRTLELLDQRGVAQRFLDEGTPAQVAGFSWFRLDIGDLPTRYPHGLALWQRHIERILAGWVAELGVRAYRGREMIGFEEGTSSVRVDLSDGSTLVAKYLVGCDGGRSQVRKMAGIPFEGWDATVSNLIAEVELMEEPAWGLRRDSTGIHAFSRREDAGKIGIMLTEQRTDRRSDPTLDDLREELVAIYGTDFGVHSPTWISRFTDAARQAARYRAGRILLAGDAAHVHYPIGGQGLNLGIQDAVNLGWKLAQVVRGPSGEELLDSYDEERRPVAARVLQSTLAQVALLRTDPGTEALRPIVGGLLEMDGPRRSLGAMMAGLDIRYDLEGEHPLTGRRMPDLDLVTADGPIRLYSLLHEARPIFLSLGGPTGGPTPESVSLLRVNAACDGTIELPVVGAVETPEAVLIRPDGHVAWAGPADDPRVPDIARRWFGRYIG